MFAGTELGVFFSSDDGATWKSLQLNLPVSPVHDLLVKGDDLVVATHGRAFWILDNVTPLRQADAVTGDVVLLAPQKAYRLHYPDAVDRRRPVGENPPAGAMIDYVLKFAPKDELTIDILGPDGKSIRHLSSTKTSKEIQPPEWPDQIVPNDMIAAKAGMNRLIWDMRMDDPAQIPGAFYSGSAPRGPLAPPGRYTVKLSVGGVTRTAPLDILVDPREPQAGPAIAEKISLAVTVEQDIDTLHKTVNAVRKARAELADALKAPKAPTAKILSVDRQLQAIEEQLMQVNMKGSEANLAFPGMLNEQYAGFAAALEDADTPPTAQHKAMYKKLRAGLDVQLALWAKVSAGPLADLPKPSAMQP